ncbi:MAG: response regulator [Moraxellaceae bacterium]|jgi:two-component system cell cycle response regulator|nr:response regulator [Moraxellaceae bacterium]HQX89819.1 response regulator [Moraxellaceae bacterium]
MSEPTVESKPRVLMVDDSKVIRMAANKILGKDFDVVVAADGEEGWQQLLDDHSIHVVFTDLMMPVLDGLGLLDRIRASDDPGIQNLPVIMVTGADNSEEARETALNRGATDFLQKPFNSIDLQARARAHCNYQRESLALKKQITVDATTGLNNQQSFLEQLSKDLAFAHRHRQSVAIVIAEMPDFKSFFMQNGKVAAEAALSQAAHLVRECIRTEDSASRYTISTLALSLPSTPGEGAIKLVEKLQQALKNAPLQVNGRALAVKWRFSVHVPDITPETNAQTEVQAAIGKLGLAAVAIHSTKPTSISIDKALAMITRGQGDLVAEHIPHLLQEIIPLLQQATPEQRWNLMKQID